MIEVSVYIEGLDEFTNIAETEIEKKLFAGMREALAYTEQVQIRAYTSTANPSLPPGSDYQRTFDLRRSSKVTIAARKLPQLRGEWIADPRLAPYAEYVIGPKSRQASIHQGRWKSLEDIAEAVEKKIGEIFNEALNEVSI